MTTILNHNNRGKPLRPAPTNLRENKILREENERMKEAVEKLKKENVRDELTGLYNRAYFSPRLQEDLELLDKPANERRESEQKFEYVSVVFCDIDDFKQINDTYGHEVGDQVLKKVSETFNENVRAYDVVARMGGEEIAICMPGASEEAALKKAEELRGEVESLDFGEYPDLEVSVSIGVSSTDEKKDMDKFISEADRAMYGVKQDGKNQVMSWSEYRKRQEEKNGEQ